MKPSRRRFCSMATVGGGLLSLNCGSALAANLEADLIVHNARVYTVDARQPRAEAFAVSDGRFVAVGSSEEVLRLARPKTQLLDAKGMTVTPGFIDAHCHADGEMLLYEVLVGNPFAVELVALDSVIAKLKAKAAATSPGMWVEGFFFDDTKVKERRELRRQDLDRVSETHPVMVRHRGGHTAYVNTKALQLAGITRDTPPPPGGTFDRDASGELTGRITDNALSRFRTVGERPTFSPEEKFRRSVAGAAHISEAFTRYGLTSVVHEGGDLAAIQQARLDGALRHRVNYEVLEKALGAMIDNGIRTGFGDEWVRFGGTFEHMVDGSFSERTMALSTPYPGAASGYRGNVTTTQDALNAWVERVHRAGVQVNCHANGDVAIGMALTAIERVQSLFPRRDTRHRITHCTLINNDLVGRIKRAGVVPAVFTTYAYYNADKFRFYGEELMQRCMAFRSFLDAGVPVCAGSDFYPGPFAPLMGIQGMVTRRGWNGEVWGANQRISVAEALRVNTLHGAYATGEDHLKGSITAGKLADFVVLADDPHTVDPEKIKDIEIVRTVTGGQTMFSA